MIRVMKKRQLIILIMLVSIGVIAYIGTTVYLYYSNQDRPAGDDVACIDKGYAHKLKQPGKTDDEPTCE